MTQYRTESTFVDAIQFTGGPESASAVTDWLKRHGHNAYHREGVTPRPLPATGPFLANGEYVYASTAERGYLRVDPGEWVLTTPQGHLYTSSNEDFEAAGYEAVTEATQPAPHHDGLLKLGAPVTFTGTVVKVKDPTWSSIRYVDAPLPGFTGYRWAEGNEVTHHAVAQGFVHGKRRYTSMEHDEGMWIPDGVQVFTAYLVAWHLSRKPVIVRLDQILPAKEALP